VALTAQRPEVRRGDAWRFAVHDRLRDLRAEESRRVIEVDGRRIVCELASTDPAFAAGRAEYTREWNLLSRPATTAPGDEPDPDNRWLWTPHYPQFRFPLAPGRSWQGKATVENRATDTRNVHAYRARVLAATRVTVAAGTFDVLPVRFESTVASDDGLAQLAWRNAETLFYAPQVNLFARYEQSITGPDGRPARELMIELVRYEPAR
jgi:hypothetical protein